MAAPDGAISLRPGGAVGISLRPGGTGGGIAGGFTSFAMGSRPQVRRTSPTLHGTDLPKPPRLSRGWERERHRKECFLWTVACEFPWCLAKASVLFGGFRSRAQ